MSSVICVVLVAVVVIAVEAFCFKRKIHSEQEKVDTLEKEKNSMLEEKQNTVAKLEEVNQKITENDRIGNALCGTAKETEYCCYDTEAAAIYQLTFRSDRRCHIICCHKPGSKHQTSSKDMA